MTKMRFKKGSKIEVFSQKKDPSGCWRCGEILSGNGHTYAVRYDADMDSCGGEVIDRVPRKAMRPCPPVIDVGDVWVSDDAVEVFHSLAWRVATVVRAVSGGRYLVRLLGLHHELEVDECVMRRRLRWLDDKWVDFPKGSYEGLKHNEHSILKYDLGLVPTSGTGSGYLKDKFFSMGNIGYAQETEAVLSRSLKRTNPFQHSGTESHARPYQKDCRKACVLLPIAKLIVGMFHSSGVESGAVWLLKSSIWGHLSFLNEYAEGRGSSILCLLMKFAIYGHFEAEMEL